MDDLFKPEEKKRPINKLFIVAFVAALALVAVAIYLLSFKPPMEQQAAQILEGSLREGTPDFAAANKDIIISTDDNTVESPTGLGTISMYIKGNIKNRGSRNVTALEVNVSVINTKNEVLREKRVLVVPLQHPNLPPGETVPITLDIPGFSPNDDRANIRWKVTAIKFDK